MLSAYQMISAYVKTILNFYKRKRGFTQNLTITGVILVKKSNRHFKNFNIFHVTLKYYYKKGGDFN